MTSSPITSWKIDGEKMETVTDFIFLGSKITWMVTTSMKLKDNCSLEKSYGFSSSHVWMWELDYTESWALTSWCFWTVALEKTLESPLDCKEIQPVRPKGDQSWVFIGRTDAEAETPDAKSWLIWKDPDAWKDWGKEEKGMTKDEMVGWHHWPMDMNLGGL